MVKNIRPEPKSSSNMRYRILCIFKRRFYSELTFRKQTTVNKFGFLSIFPCLSVCLSVSLNFTVIMASIQLCLQTDYSQTYTRTSFVFACPKFRGHISSIYFFCSQICCCVEVFKPFSGVFKTSHAFCCSYCHSYVVVAHHKAEVQFVRDMFPSPGKYPLELEPI